MPRPLVEVRQTVLNPVVTVNDPTQQVCLVGLHVEQKNNTEVHKLNRLTGLAAGVDLHINAAVAATFSVDEAGVIINSDIDLGPDAFDLDGDLELSLSAAQASVESILGFTNCSISGGTIESYAPFQVSLASTLSAYAQENLDDLSVVVKPKETHYNRLVYSSGSVIDLSSGVIDGDVEEVNTAVRDLVVGGTITLVDSNSDEHSCKIISITPNVIHVYGVTVADNTALNSTMGAVDLKISNNTVSGTKFKLELEGNIEAKVVGANETFTTLFLDTAVPFVSVGVTTGYGAVLKNLSASELANIVISELDTVNPLVVTSLSTGDVSFNCPGERLKLGAYYLVTATLTSSYSVALVSNSTGVVTVNANNVESVLGSVTPRNQLAVAAQLALLNSGDSSVGVLALDLTPAEGETAAKSLADAFQDALVILNKNSNVYAMVPLTQNLATVQAYTNAAESLSAPKKGKFRICLGTSEGAPLVDYIIASDTAPSVTGTITNGDISDPANPFRLPASKVLQGDTVILVDSNDATHTGTVSSASNTLLEVTWDGAQDPASIASYYVSRSLANRRYIPRQIEILTAVANSVANKRLFLTFPGRCSVQIGDLSYSEAPAFFVTAAFSGLLARLEIHRPKNFVGLAGIVGLSNFTRFSDDQLDQISDAGYLVFQQEEADSAPFCIHQVNTYHGVQAGTQEFTELSVLANFDFVSRYFKEILDPFAGTMNIVPSTFGIIQASLESGIANLQSRRVSTIGAPLLTGSVEYVRQATYDQGTVEANVLVTIPKVLNRLILEVVSG